jgi:hypothetical protein
MSPRIGGVLGILLGLACIGFAWYLAQNEGKIYFFPCLLGPAILPYSLALVALPPNWVMRPKEIDGRIEYDTRNPSYTPFGIVLIVIGLACAGGFYVFLRYGL